MKFFQILIVQLNTSTDEMICILHEWKINDSMVMRKSRLMMELTLPQQFDHYLTLDSMYLVFHTTIQQSLDLN